jgi:hypothetical protein
MPDRDEDDRSAGLARKRRALLDGFASSWRPVSRNQKVLLRGNRILSLAPNPTWAGSTSALLRSKAAVFPRSELGGTADAGRPLPTQNQCSPKEDLSRRSLIKNRGRACR